MIEEKELQRKEEEERQRRAEERRKRHEEFLVKKSQREEENKKIQQENEERRLQREREVNEWKSQTSVKEIVTEFNKIPTQEPEPIKLDEDTKFIEKTLKYLQNSEFNTNHFLKNKKRSDKWWLKCDKKQNTIFHHCVLKSFYNPVKILFDNHPQIIFQKNKDGKTPIDLLFEIGDRQSTEFKILFNIFYQKRYEFEEDIQKRFDEFCTNDSGYFNTITTPAKGAATPNYKYRSSRPSSRNSNSPPHPSPRNSNRGISLF